MDELSAQRLAELQKTMINESSPGPLLANIEILIDFIGTGLKTTSDYYVLPLAVLAELNAALVDPLLHEFKRPQLRSFPTLMGLFMLLRGCGLAVGQAKPQRVVMIDPAALEQWRAFNPAERYFNLLAAFLYESSWDCVGLSNRGEKGLVSNIHIAYGQMRSRAMKLEYDPDDFFYRIEYAVVAALLHQFGWLRLAYQSKPIPGKSTVLREIKRTKFGDAMFVLVDSLDHRSDDNKDSLHATLQPIFPARQNTFTRVKPEFREGDHQFKVRIGKDIWRRIVAPANATLNQLAGVILDAFQFESDHLYRYELCDSTGTEIDIVGPYIREGTYFGDEMRVGELPLQVGEAMVFHFDFGANWRFIVTFEAVLKGKSKDFKLTAKAGAAPKQYGNDDDDSWLPNLANDHLQALQCRRTKNSVLSLP